MKTYIALFRGINIGGRHILPMKSLRKILADLGLKDVKTYIQSGNVVFRTNRENLINLAGQISTEIKTQFDFAPRVFLIDEAKLLSTINNNPFPEGEEDPRFLHVLFLDSKPDNPELQTLNDIKTNTEQFELKGDVFYLYAPDGVGRSKLANRAEKLLGVPTTGRNWRTLLKIREMI